MCVLKHSLVPVISFQKQCKEVEKLRLISMVFWQSSLTILASAAWTGQPGQGTDKGTLLALPKRRVAALTCHKLLGHDRKSRFCDETQAVHGKTMLTSNSSYLRLIWCSLMEWKKCNSWASFQTVHYCLQIFQRLKGVRVSVAVNGSGSSRQKVWDILLTIQMKVLKRNFNNVEHIVSFSSCLNICFHCIWKAGWWWQRQLFHCQFSP